MQQESHAHETLNTETLEAMSELEESGGKLFTGSTENFFKMLTESENLPKSKGMCSPAYAFFVTYEL